MKTYQSDYHTYLFRLWRVRENDGAHWRASLENVQTGELCGFEDITVLLGYLEELVVANKKDEGFLNQQPE